MKANEYKLMEECVERGIVLGYNRAFKHNDEPSQQDIENNIKDAIMIEICEYFNFDNDQEKE